MYYKVKFIAPDSAFANKTESTQWSITFLFSSSAVLHLHTIGFRPDAFHSNFIPTSSRSHPIALITVPRAYKSHASSQYILVVVKINWMLLFLLKNVIRSAAAQYLHLLVFSFDIKLHKIGNVNMYFMFWHIPCLV